MLHNIQLVWLFVEDGEEYTSRQANKTCGPPKFNRSYECMYLESIGSHVFLDAVSSVRSSSVWALALESCVAPTPSSHQV